ncbi:hypothetical protein TorRG33x02_124650 [Trema orientale]|uniref:Uncharacterized protein n=1 Tax=Trema orientale TaxID=63057 RepID=A0A2P5F249_TREOI|nr:hypothetical protein TorRG33x02_124650 [Trema orientale]
MVLDYLGFKAMTWGESFLGNPLLLTNNCTRDFLFIKERVISRLEGWKAKLLSRADMDKAVRKFWWTGSLEKNKFLALTCWDMVCQPKSRGGLGIRRFSDINFAFLSKLGWLLASGSESLWAEILRNKYCHNGNFWSSHLPTTTFVMAKGIWSTRDFIKNNSCYLVGIGANVDLWNAP